MTDIIKLPLLLTLLLSTLSSCCIYDDYGECQTQERKVKQIRVKFDWSQYPEANPASMMLFLYPKTGGESTVQREFVGKDGGMTQAVAGVGYSVLAFNSDPQNTYFNSVEGENSYVVSSVDATTIGSFALSASALPRAEGAENERIAAEADSIYAANGEIDSLMTRAAQSGDTVDIVLYPKPMFHTYRVIVHGMKDTKNLSSTLAGSISGLAGGVNLVTGERIKETVTIPFAAHVADDSTLVADFLCYGDGVTEITELNPTSQTENKLVVYTHHNDGSKWSYNTTVTEQVKEQVKEKPDEKVQVEVTKLPDPDKIVDKGGGIDADVNNWEDIVIPTPM